MASAPVPPGVDVVTGDALHAVSFLAFVRSGDTFVHLVGTPDPSPAKAAEFRRVVLPRAAASGGRAARDRRPTDPASCAMTAGVA
jgi:hypothetical protein